MTGTTGAITVVAGVLVIVAFRYFIAWLSGGKPRHETERGED
jgi:hypothetical protein